AATFDFAAVMAVAARVYKPFDAAYAEQCLTVAKSAYAWGIANPDVAFSNPYDVATGEYGDSWLEDEKLFAGTELALTTGDASYTQDGATRSVPSWGDVAGLATYEKAAHADAYGSEGSAAKDSLLKTADVFVARAETGFGVVMDYSDFVWGSNAVAANQGVWLLHAYYLTGEKKYYEAATKVLDYLLGKNPLNMSFLTGYGSKSPMLPHHRPSTADRITDPVPGMLVGGPQPGGEDIGSNSWECSDYTTGYPATSYIDNRCSYASNEVAINWNAPFAYLAGAIEALNAGYAPNFAVDGITGIHQKPMVSRKARVDNSARLRFSGEMLFIEKNGKRFNLNGHRIK
ncbi:MAG: glycoside hydrolase family 9 protein, partial [Hallerella sp.]|nr:glycoside hydrolase family 9 protein [Hallerella sp.]